MLKNARRAFTLIEIMIVVLIIGILLAIAVPNFQKAREASRTKACQSNLRQIQSAKEQWAMDKKADGEATPSLTADLAGAGKYIAVEPKCPSSDATYSPNKVDANPTCGWTNASKYEHVINVTSGT